jgi:hypothetical protein
MKKMAMSKKLPDNSVIVLYWDGIHRQYVIDTPNENSLQFQSFDNAQKYFNSCCNIGTFVTTNSTVTDNIMKNNSKTQSL